MLQAHGYGVLAYDTRGHGESDGTTNALGWNAEKDASAALDYLESRDDVEPGRVGLLGLSMGAEIALEMATKDHSAAAIVADGAGVRSSREMKDVSFGWSKFVSYPVAAGMTWGTALFRLEMPPAALSGYIDDIQTPVFYIASDQIAEERELNETWSKLTTSEHQLWKADASHTGGLKTQPKEYESRVIAWFDAHLLEKAR
jgi:pimeloyl-ACP methyl ester carboxylesterase